MGERWKVLKIFETKIGRLIIRQRKQKLKKGKLMKKSYLIYSRGQRKTDRNRNVEMDEMKKNW